MTNTAFLIFLLIVAIAYLPRHESAVIRHELAKRKLKPEDDLTKELYNFRYDNDDNSNREKVGKFVNPDTEINKLLQKGQHGYSYPAPPIRYIYPPPQPKPAPRPAPAPASVEPVTPGVEVGILKNLAGLDGKP